MEETTDKPLTNNHRLQSLIILITVHSCKLWNYSNEQNAITIAYFGPNREYKIVWEVKSDTDFDFVNFFLYY